MDLAHVTWRKASYSGSNNQCVEVGVWREASYSTANGTCVEVSATGAVGPDVVLVRDSKDRDGGRLAFTAAAWDAFVAGVKRGAFDRR